MAAVAARAEKLDFGNVLRETGAVLRRNLTAFGLIALIAVGGAHALSLLLGTLRLKDLAPPDARFSAASALMILIQLASACFGQAAIFTGVADDQRGDRPAFSSCLSGGVRGAPLVLGAGLISLFWFVLGYVFFFVPGLMVATALIVATPAAVIERRGVFAAISRSRQLTKGNRWKIFGLMILYLLIYFVLILPILALVGLNGGSGQRTGYSILAITLFSSAAGLISSLLANVGLAVLYFQLRNLKDGSGAENLAAVFD